MNLRAVLPFCRKNLRRAYNCNHRVSFDERNAGCFLGHLLDETPNAALSALRCPCPPRASTEADDVAAPRQLPKVQAKSAISGILDVDRNDPPPTPVGLRRDDFILLPLSHLFPGRIPFLLRFRIPKFGSASAPASGCSGRHSNHSLVLSNLIPFSLLG